MAKNAMSHDPINTSTKQNPVGRFMVAAGAVIELEKTGKILLLQRNSTLDWQANEWEIPYGRLDQFEDVPTGLKREVFEELGINDLELISLLSVWHIFRGSEKAENELIGITYHCRTHSKAVRLSPEHAGYKWVTPQEALTLVTVPGIKRDIEKFIEIASSPPNRRVLAMTK